MHLFQFLVLSLFLCFFHLFTYINLLFLMFIFMFFLILLILFRCSFFLFLPQFFLPFFILSCGASLLFLPFGAVDLFLLFYVFDPFLFNIPFHYRPRKTDLCCVLMYHFSRTVYSQ